MQLVMERRAEISFRSLQNAERKHVEHTFNEIISVDRNTLQQSHKFQKLVAGLSGRKIFVYRASLKLRLVLSFDGDTCIIEDIIDRGRLDRLVKREAQE